MASDPKDDVSLYDMKQRVGEALALQMNTARWSITSREADDSVIVICDRWASNEFTLTLEKVQ